jgi:4-amino-4-deoxy-L-arabinose transferase-like glycosyltransferase
VSYTIAPTTSQRTGFAISPSEPRALFWALLIFCVLLLLANLGGAALFEPDESRNAEKAREILLLRNWITPHENFLPVLDKPIFFYWLIALAYQLFGVSEWSARLPSALAALGCLVVVYRFARMGRGVWAARWSMLILLTSTEFFLLARVVISDMTLTFFITVALVSFYSAVRSENQRTRLLSCLLMYTALGLGTLVKGLPGLVVPGMVAFFYVLLTRKWRLLRELHLIEGAVLYLLLVTPWYAWAGAENPGYLGYFLRQEHFSRYWTEEFKHSESWYYFFAVLTVGFLPWTPLIPLTVKRLWERMDDRDLFLALWATLPFIFFSASSSKLPHYLLPVFPPLAILTAQTVVTMFSLKDVKSGGLFTVWGICVILLLYLALGTIVPDVITWRIRGAVEQSRFAINVGAVLVLSVCGFFAWSYRNRGGADQRRTFISTGLTLSTVFLVVLQLQDLFSLTRSTKTLAESIAPYVNETRLVLFNTYPAGLMFYLRLNGPMSVVAASGRKTPVMDSQYLQQEQATGVSRFGKVLFTAEEFSGVWSKADPSMRVLLKEGHLSRFQREVGAATKPLIKAGGYLLVARQ